MAGYDVVCVHGRNVCVHRFWSARSVREACVNNGLYTCGDNHDYAVMLRNVELCVPVLENLYSIARDISSHSREWASIAEVMSILEREAISVSYSFESF